MLNGTQRGRDTSGSLKLRPVALAIIEAEGMAAMAVLARDCQYCRRVQATGDQYDSRHSGGLRFSGQACLPTEPCATGAET